MHARAVEDVEADLSRYLRVGDTQVLEGPPPGLAAAMHWGNERGGGPELPSAGAIQLDLDRVLIPTVMRARDRTDRGVAMVVEHRRRRDVAHLLLAAPHTDQRQLRRPRRLRYRRGRILDGAQKRHDRKRQHAPSDRSLAKSNRGEMVHILALYRNGYGIARPWVRGDRQMKSSTVVGCRRDGSPY